MKGPEGPGAIALDTIALATHHRGGFAATTMRVMGVLFAMIAVTVADGKA
jgi:hypothetical protein